MHIRRRNRLAPFNPSSQLVIMDTIDQILGSHCLFILWQHADGSSDGKSMLDQSWRNSNHPLKRTLDTLLHIGLLTVACRCREVRIEIGIAKTPAPWCQIKPGVS